MMNGESLNINIQDEQGVINEVENIEGGMIRVDDGEDQGTLYIETEIPQEFIDKYHKKAKKNVQTKHRADNPSDNKQTTCSYQEAA